MKKRPTTLIEIASAVSVMRLAVPVTDVVDGHFIDPAYMRGMKEYLDEVVLMDAAGVVASIADEPALITPLMDAHIAGMAEYLAFRNEVPCPEWANKPNRFLKDPVFFGGANSRGLLMASTTFSMRRRNLFCGEITLPVFKK